MQPNRWLIEYKDRIRLSFSHLAGKLQPLCLSTRQARRLLAQRQVTESQILQYLQALAHNLPLRRCFQRSIHIHIHQLWQGILRSLFRLIADLPCFLPIPRSVAFRTWYIHVRQELHIEADLPCSITHRTSQLSGIIGEIACLIARFLRIWCLCIYLPQFIVYIRIRCDCRPHIDSDWRCVNQLHMRDSLC